MVMASMEANMMNWTATVEIPALVMVVICLFAFVGVGAVSRMFMPKIRRWAVVEPSDGHVVAIHARKDYAEGLVHGRRQLVEMVGVLKP